MPLKWTFTVLDITIHVIWCDLCSCSGYLIIINNSYNYIIYLILKSCLIISGKEQQRKMLWRFLLCTRVCPLNFPFRSFWVRVLARSYQSKLERHTVAPRYNEFRGRGTAQKKFVTSKHINFAKVMLKNYEVEWGKRLKDQPGAKSMFNYIERTALKVRCLEE